MHTGRGARLSDGRFCVQGGGAFPCRRAPASWLDWAAVLGAFALIFAFVFAAFYGRGAFGSDDLYGIGRLWAITDIAMLLYILTQLRFLRWRTPMVTITCLWLFWVSCTCLQLSEQGIDGVRRGLLQVFYCPVFFLFFYILAKREPDFTGLIIRLFILVLLLCSFMFWMVFGYQNLSVQMGSALLNDAYYVLLLLPFVLISREKLVRYGGIALVFLVVFWSMKRTAFAALVAALAFYFVAELVRLRSWLNLRWLAGVALAIVAGASLFNYVGDNSGEYFISRLEAAETDRGSRRLDIYQYVLALQADASLEGWILGHGHNSVLAKSRDEGMLPASAHNDWQEVLFDYGLPGFLLYVLFHLNVLRLNWRMIRQGSEFAPAVAASYAIFLSLSLTSHLVLYATYFSYLMAFWGLAAAEHERLALVGNSARRGYGVWLRSKNPV